MGPCNWIMVSFRGCSFISCTQNISFFVLGEAFFSQQQRQYPRRKRYSCAPLSKHSWWKRICYEGVLGVAGEGQGLVQANQSSPADGMNPPDSILIQELETSWKIPAPDKDILLGHDDLGEVDWLGTIIAKKAVTSREGLSRRWGGTLWLAQLRIANFSALIFHG